MTASVGTAPYSPHNTHQHTDHLLNKILYVTTRILTKIYALPIWQKGLLTCITLTSVAIMPAAAAILTSIISIAIAILLHKLKPEASSNTTPSLSPVLPSLNATTEPKGIENPRNNCFMNALMQALLINRNIFNAVLKSFLQIPDLNEDDKNALGALVQLVNEQNNEDIKILSRLCKLRLVLPESMRDHSQEDPHELFMNLTKNLSEKDSKDLFVSRRELRKHENPEWIETTETIASLFIDSIHLPNPQEKSHLEGQDLIDKIYDSWTSTDNPDRPYQIKQEIEGPFPLMYTIQVCRFNSSGGKVTTSVNMPNTITVQEQAYQLKSFVQHIGRGAQSGHYVTYLTTGSDQWQRADDIKVNTVSPERVAGAQTQGYLYFYEQMTQK